MQIGPQAGKQFIFVTADAQGQPAAGERRFIRSHVMRGKNTRRPALAGRLNNHLPTTASRNHPSEIAARGGEVSKDARDARTRYELLNSEVENVVRMRYQGMIPRATNVFAFIKFPQDIDSSSRSLLGTCTSLFSDHQQWKPYR